MFQSLLNWFSGAKDWLDWLWRECWRQGAKVLQSVWGIALILSGWVWTVAHWVGQTVAEIAHRIDAFVMPNFSHGSTSFTAALSLANTILPLQEILAFAVAYLLMMVALTIYRLIKSWIPTLS